MTRLKPIEPNCRAIVMAFNPPEVVGREVVVKQRASPGLYRNGGNNPDVTHWHVPEGEPYWVIDILDGRIGISHERYLMRIDGEDDIDENEKEKEKFDPSRMIVLVNGEPL